MKGYDLKNGCKMKQNKHMLSGYPFPFSFEAKRKFGSKRSKKKRKKVTFERISFRFISLRCEIFRCRNWPTLLFYGFVLKIQFLDTWQGCWCLPRAYRATNKNTGVKWLIWYWKSTFCWFWPSQLFQGWKVFGRKLPYGATLRSKVLETVAIIIFSQYIKLTFYWQ